MILPRIDSFGSGLLIIVSPQPQLIELSSLVSIQYLERSCSGKQKRPIVASFLFGLCYTIVVGQLQGGSVITCRTMTLAVPVSSSLKPSRTFLLAAFMPGRFGPIYFADGTGLGWPLGCQLTWSLLIGGRGQGSKCMETTEKLSTLCSC